MMYHQPRVITVSKQWSCRSPFVMYQKEQHSIFKEESPQDKGFQVIDPEAEKGS